jgi:hypothetical protein
MYVFFRNIFRVEELEICTITYVDVVGIKMVVLVLDQTFQFYQFSNLTQKRI